MLKLYYIPVPCNDRYMLKLYYIPVPCNDRYMLKLYYNYLYHVMTGIC